MGLFVALLFYLPCTICYACQTIAVFPCVVAPHVNTPITQSQPNSLNKYEVKIWQWASGPLNPEILSTIFPPIPSIGEAYHISTRATPDFDYAQLLHARRRAQAQSSADDQPQIPRKIYSNRENEIILDDEIFCRELTWDFNKFVSLI